MESPDPLKGGFAAGTVDTLGPLKGTTNYHASLIVGGASSRVWRGGVQVQYEGREGGKGTREGGKVREVPLNSISTFQPFCSSFFLP